MRDALFGRPVTELDITTAAPEAWATTLAAALNTHVVQFGDRFPLHRLSLRDGSIDLTPLAGTLDTTPTPQVLLAFHLYLAQIRRHRDRPIRNRVQPPAFAPQRGPT